MGGPLPFAAREVPLVGRPYTVKTIVPVVTIACSCEAATILTLPGVGATGQCPGCQTVFQLQAADAKLGGDSGSSIGVMRPPVVQ